MLRGGTYLIEDGDGAAGTDVIQFGPRISASDLQYQQSGNDLLVTVTNSTTVRIANWFLDASWQIEEFRTIDGAELALPSWATSGGQSQPQLLAAASTTGSFSTLSGTTQQDTASIATEQSNELSTSIASIFDGTGGGSTAWAFDPGGLSAVIPHRGPTRTSAPRASVPEWHQLVDTGAGTWGGAVSSSHQSVLAGGSDSQLGAAVTENAAQPSAGGTDLFGPSGISSAGVESESLTSPALLWHGVGVDYDWRWHGRSGFGHRVYVF